MFASFNDVFKSKSLREQKVPDVTLKYLSSKTEQKLLRVLCENRGKVLKREYLIDEVWQGLWMPMP